MNVVLDCSHSRCSVLTSINQAKLSAAMCTVAPWYALGPSFNPPLRWIHHWSCVTEGIASTARGAGPFRADSAFPYTSALLSTTFKAQPPDQHPWHTTVCHRWLTGWPWHRFHPCPRHSWVRPLATSSLFKLSCTSISFSLCSLERKRWNVLF